MVNVLRIEFIILTGVIRNGRISSTGGKINRYILKTIVNKRCLLANGIESIFIRPYFMGCILTKITIVKEIILMIRILSYLIVFCIVGLYGIKYILNQRFAFLVRGEALGETDKNPPGIVNNLNILVIIKHRLGIVEVSAITIIDRAPE